MHLPVKFCISRQNYLELCFVDQDHAVLIKLCRYGSVRRTGTSSKLARAVTPPSSAPRFSRRGLRCSTLGTALEYRHLSRYTLRIGTMRTTEPSVCPMLFD